MFPGAFIFPNDTVQAGGNSFSGIVGLIAVGSNRLDAVA